MGNLIDIPDINPESITIGNTSKSESTFNAKNYLDVRLADGEKEKSLTIRLLPMNLETGNPFVVVYMHNGIKVPKEVSKSGYKSYICLSKNNDINHDVYGNKCPFCELNKSAYEESEKETDPIKKKEWRKISVDNLAREAVIVRCIERGKENEGVKFWKFNLRTDKTDPFNQIMTLYNQRKKSAEKKGLTENILSIYKGRDLTITITEGNSAPKIFDDSDITPLTDDENKLREWVYDSKKWQDVFSVKSYDYLSLVSQMKIPWFDRSKNKWVDKNEIESLPTTNGEDMIEHSVSHEEPSFAESLEINDIDNDLPF